MPRSSRTLDPREPPSSRDTHPPARAARTSLRQPKGIPVCARRLCQLDGHCPLVLSIDSRACPPVDAPSGLRNIAPCSLALMLGGDGGCTLRARVRSSIARRAGRRLDDRVGSFANAARDWRVLGLPPYN